MLKQAGLLWWRWYACISAITGDGLNVLIPCNPQVQLDEISRQVMES